MDQQVDFTVCVKVALTHYLVGKQSHLDWNTLCRPRGIQRLGSIQCILYTLTTLTTAWTKISYNALHVHWMCIVCALYVRLLSAWKSRKLLFRRKPPAIKNQDCANQTSFSVHDGTHHINTRSRGWNFREMFISYTQWFNDNSLSAAVSIGRLWICWYRFY